jgi:hypothetical protein
MNENAEKLPQRRYYSEIVTTAGNLAFILNEMRRDILTAVKNETSCLENRVFEDLEATFSKLGEQDRKILLGRYLTLRNDLTNSYDWALVSLDDYTDGLKAVIVRDAREAYAREHPGKDLPRELQ